MERTNKSIDRAWLQKSGDFFHLRKQLRICLVGDERHTVIVATAAQDAILEKVSMAIRIRSLGQDISYFSH